jgi:hypothetical protein
MRVWGGLEIGSYYLRIRVPYRLCPVLGYEVVRSLSTVHLKFARYLASKVAYHLNTFIKGGLHNFMRPPI